MALLLTDHLLLSAPPERIWQILDKPEVLARILPGCDSLIATGPSTYAGTFSARLQFLALRIRATTVLQDLDAPRHARLVIEGQPEGLAASFVVSVPVDLEPTADGSLVRYAVDLQVTGRLAAFGIPLLRKAVRLQLVELHRNLAREFDPTTEVRHDG
ncbi:MAG TPA: SRPBCC domain-containing protein [Chloroflexota bacterium]|nr:SRPBCC domain-containing protein [Chloroflexota bacterium]